MILLFWGCDTPAVLYPVDPCRLGESFAQVHAEVSCVGAGTIDANATWSDDTRAGGTRGEGWDGLSFYATGTTMTGGTMSIGRRPGGVGLYLIDNSADIQVGFLPASTESPPEPYVSTSNGTSTCDAQTGVGTVALSGLPESWVAGGTWGLTFNHGSFEADPVPVSWSAPWPATCPIHPAAWASITVSARCEGVELAAFQLLAPASYGVELDSLGRVATVSATWSEAFSAACAGADASDVDGSLQAEEGAARIYTPILTIARAEGVWSVEDTACGTCAAFEVDVEGLPEL